MSGIGHNSLAKSKSLLIEDLIKQRDNMSKEGLEELKEKKREIKLRKFDFDVNVMGKELSELRYDPETGRRLSDENYGKLVCKIFETVEHTAWFTRPYRAACQWAYENPEDLEKVKEDNPRCLSVLTLYMRKSKGEEEPDPESDEDDTDNGVVDPNKGGNDSKPGSGNSPSGQGGNTGSNKPSGGSSGDSKDTPKNNKGTNKDEGKPSWNTKNPDTEVVNEPIGRIASSMVGVVTTFKFWEQTNGRRLDTEELANALLHEVMNEALEKYTEEEVISYIDDMRYVLNTIAQSLPIINGPDTNVVNFKKTKENY
jgi:hypothetical protein